MTKQSFQDLVERCARGDAKSQRLLYDALKGRLMGVCLRYNTNPEDANDVFQEAMIRLFKNIEKAKEVKNFNAWARTIATNAAIDAYKKRKTDMLVSLDEGEVMEFSSDQANIIDKLQAQELLSLLQLLPANQMIVFNLYMIDGHNHKEISVKLGIAESTSRVLLTRAKKKMIELLKKMEIHERVG